MSASPWNSLERAKFAASLLTPVVLLLLGVLVNNSVKDSERAIGLRIEIYKAVGADLNDVYSYVSFVGGWKDMTPVEVVSRKRSIDRTMYRYRPFFSDELFRTYEQFMAETFSPYGGPGTDARIRSDIATADGDRRAHTTKGWEQSWDDRFTKERNKEAQRQAYERFLQQLARDLRLQPN